MNLSKFAVAALVALLCLGAGFPVAFAEDNNAIQAEETPAAVKEAFKKLAGDAEVGKIRRQGKGDKVRYFAKWKADGLEQEAWLNQAGNLLRFEGGVKADKVPAEVVKAAKKKLGDNATIRYFKTVTAASGDKAQKITYEAEAFINGAEKEGFFNEKGEEVEEDEDADFDDDEDENDDDDDDNDDSDD